MNSTTSKAISPSDVEFRLVPKGEIDDALNLQLLALITEAFPDWPDRGTSVDRLEYLRWKQSSPAGRFAARVGLLDGRVVAGSSGWGFRVRVEGKNRLVLDFGDTATVPEFQGRGLYSAMNRLSMSEAKYDLTIDETAVPALIRANRENGSFPIGHRGHLFRKVMIPTIIGKTSTRTQTPTA